MRNAELFSLSEKYEKVKMSSAAKIETDNILFFYFFFQDLTF